MIENTARNKRKPIQKIWNSPLWGGAIFNFIDRELKRPGRVAVVCGLVVLYAVVLDGTLFQLRKLYLSSRALDQKTQEIQTKNQMIVEKVEKLSDPRFLEKEVRDRFDLAGEGDLVFIFPEDE